MSLSLTGREWGEDRVFPRHESKESDDARAFADTATRHHRGELLRRWQQALSDRSFSLQAANRLIDDARRYEDLLQERAKAAASAEDTTKALNDIRDTLTAHREAVANIVGHLSSCFDAVLHEFVSTDIKGEVKLDGNGFALKIQMGGERSTAAIESLKVVAFDLSSLIMTIEGRTNLSGFMVHDSPREADLG